MSIRPVVLQLPDDMYDRLQQRAEQAHHTLESELLEVLASAVTASDELSRNLAEALSSLAFLDDDDLWRAARSHLPKESAARLESLHLKAQRVGLTDREKTEEAALLRKYERCMLVRAEAAALLNHRGHDIHMLAPEM